MSTGTTQPKSGGGRPTQYKTKDGKRVPGVTTILKYKDPGPLMWWAHQQGIAGLDFRDTRDAAASVGHCVHQWVEDTLHGRELTPSTLAGDDLKAASAGLDAFETWRSSVSLTVVATECPLVSELHAYGGTLDAVCLVGQKPVLLDWKTSKGVYAEYIAQLAAYRQLLRENAKSSDEAPQEAYLLRFGKEYGDFHMHHLTSEILDLGWELFQASKWMHQMHEKLKRVL